MAKYSMILIVFECVVIPRPIDRKVHAPNMGLTWVLSAPDGPHVGPWTLLSGYSTVSARTPKDCVLNKFGSRIHVAGAWSLRWHQFPGALCMSGWINAGRLGSHTSPTMAAGRHIHLISLVLLKYFWMKAFSEGKMNNTVAFHNEHSSRQSLVICFS